MCFARRHRVKNLNIREDDSQQTKNTTKEHIHFNTDSLPKTKQPDACLCPCTWNDSTNHVEMVRHGLDERNKNVYNCGTRIYDSKNWNKTLWISSLVLIPKCAASKRAISMRRLDLNENTHTQRLDFYWRLKEREIAHAMGSLAVLRDHDCRGDALNISEFAFHC